MASPRTYLDLSFEHYDVGEDARAAAQVVLLAEKEAVGIKCWNGEARDVMRVAPLAEGVSIGRQS